MTKLKTLKDLPISPLRKPKGTELAYLDWFKEQLKQKVIKLVKKHWDEGYEKVELMIDFHNITEEDLK